MPWRCPAREHLDDDHAAAAAWAARLAGIDSGHGGLAVRFCSREQLTNACDVDGASAFGEQAVVADAVPFQRGKTMGRSTSRASANQN